MNNSINSEPTVTPTPQPGRVHYLFLRSLFRTLLALLLGVITLIALIYAVENWRGKRAWETHRKQVEAKGEVLDIQQLKPPPVPDNQNFAMTPFLAPLFDFKPGTQTYRDTNNLARIQSAFERFPSAPRGAGDWRKGQRLDLTAWLTAFNEQALRAAGKRLEQTNASPSSGNAEAAAVILKLLKEYDPILDEIRAASRRPYARFNVRYEEPNPVNILLPHLAKLKSLVQVLSLKATAELRLNQTDAAIEDLNLAFYLTETIRKEPFLISQLVRCAHIQLAMQPLWEGMADHRWSESQLQVIEQKLRKFDFLADDLFAMRGERTFGNTVISFLRNNRSMMPQLGDMSSNGERNIFDLFAALVPRGWFYMEQLNYDRLFEERVLPGVNAAARRVDPRLIEHNAQLLGNDLRPRFSLVMGHRILASMLLPALVQAHRKFAYVQTISDEATVACAIERHRIANGKLPDSLQALVPRFLDQLPADLITGEPLKYRRTDSGGFILYSVGWNQTDDGGSLSLTGKKGSGNLDLMQGDWVWQCP